MSGWAAPWTKRLEPALQGEAAECGLACLTMVARWHGHRVNLAGLRQRFATSMKGVTLQNLIRMASALHLGPRPVRLDLDELHQLRLPAILHWDLDHFVVLEAIARDGVTIVDPARGRRRIGAAQLSRSFTGVALELQPTADFQPIQREVRTKLTDLYSRLTNYRSAAGQVLGLSLMIQLLALVTPFFMQLVIDEAVTQSDLTLIPLLGLGFGAIYLLSALIESLRAWVVLTLSQSLSAQLGANVVRHLLRLPLAFFERRHVGDLTSRIGSLQPIETLLTEGFINVAIDAALSLTTLVAMYLISPLLASVVLGSTVLMFVVSFALFPMWRSRSEQAIVARADETSYLLETMRAIRTIKLFGREDLREVGWRNKNADVVSATYHADMFAIRVALVERIAASLQFVAVIWLGALAVIGEAMTIGILIAFLAYRNSFVEGATRVINQVQNWRMVGLHLDRLSDIVAEPAEQLQPGFRAPGAVHAPAIRAENLSFAYSPTEKPILSNVSFEIAAGEFVAIVGPSGVGKTTLMRLLLGLLTPTGGRILIDGVPLGPATLAAWRERVGAVLQDDALLTGTIADNIGFFDSSPDHEAIERCARFAHIHDDIAAMPMGYSSLIGDMGSALSGGQRQRLILARAMYRRPDALFLDEGTANLDQATEAAIGDAVATLPATRVAIAHRPALIERAGRILEISANGVAMAAPRAAPQRPAPPVPATPPAATIVTRSPVQAVAARDRTVTPPPVAAPRPHPSAAVAFQAPEKAREPVVAGGTTEQGRLASILRAELDRVDARTGAGRSQ